VASKHLNVCKPTLVYNLRFI